MNKLIVGIDEVGRGALYGEVVAAAVALPLPAITVGDSKRFSARARAQKSAWLWQHALCAVSAVDARTIDTINIHAATLLAMQNALQKLLATLSAPMHIDVRVDGRHLFTPPKSVHDLHLTAIIGGDGIDENIGAASLVAKVYRDDLMLDAHAKYPTYGFDKHKGYGTKAHLKALDDLGALPHHRQSYAPVKRTGHTDNADNDYLQTT